MTRRPQGRSHQAGDDLCASSVVRRTTYLKPMQATTAGAARSTGQCNPRSRPSGHRRKRPHRPPRRERAVKQDLASEIDSKLADFEAGRISVAELETYLGRVESSLPKGPGADGSE